MSSNKKEILERYSTGLENLRAYRSRSAGMEFHYSKRVLSGFIDENDSVVEIGCGTGYYAEYFAGRCKSYVGVDLSPDNITIFNDKMTALNIKNVRASVGDATDLFEIQDCCFDVVLTLGPLYHLPEAERQIVIRESKRICKEKGTLAFSYINLAGAYVHACLSQNEEVIYPNKLANNSVIIKREDDIHPNLFYYTMPEDIGKMVQDEGLEVVKNVGVSFVFNDSFIDGLSVEKYEAWLELTDFMYESPSCAGLSEFGLLICRKS